MFFFPNHLPEAIFRGSKRPSILTTTFLDRFSIFRGVPKSNLGATCSAKWVTKNLTRLWRNPPWSRPGRDLVPNTVQWCILIDLESYSDRLQNDFGQIGNEIPMFVFLLCMRLLIKIWDCFPEDVSNNLHCVWLIFKILKDVPLIVQPWLIRILT